jgi:hypothetical protein
MNSKHLGLTCSREIRKVPIEVPTGISEDILLLPTLQENAAHVVGRFFKEVVKQAKDSGTYGRIPFISFLQDKRQSEQLSLLRSEPLNNTIVVQSIAGKPERLCAFYFPNCTDNEFFQSKGSYSKEYYMAVEDNPFLLYTYVQLAAACSVKGKTFKRKTLQYPFCRLFHFDSKTRKAVSNTVIVALLLTRCNSPRLDMLVYDEDSGKLQLMNSNTILMDSWCSPRTIISDDYRCKLYDMMVQHFIINRWTFDHSRSIKLDTHQLGDFGKVVSVETVLNSLKEWNLIKGTSANPIESENLVMCAHVHKLEIELKESNEKILTLQEQASNEKRKHEDLQQNYDAKARKLLDNQDMCTKKMNAQSANISRLQKEVDSLKKQKQNQKMDTSGLATKIEYKHLENKVEELRKRSFDASSASTSSKSPCSEGALEQIQTLQAAWDREKQHADLANQRLDDEREQKKKKAEFDMNEQKLDSEHSRQIAIAAQRVSGIKSLFVDSKLEDNNIAGLNMLNGGGKLADLLFFVGSGSGGSSNIL